MAYCVKCGVELDESALKCALCETPVYLPNAGIKEETVKPFSDKSAIPPGTKRKFTAAVITVLLVIPCIVCGIVNLFLRGSGWWSAYVICSVALAWVITVFPLLTKKFHHYIMWAFDTAAVMLYAYVFFPLRGENLKYYFSFALPIILTVSVCTLLFIIWAKRKPRHWSEVMIHILVDIFIVCVLVGVICFMNSIRTGVIICLILALSDITLVGFGVYCNRSKRMRAWLRKKLFV